MKTFAYIPQAVKDGEFKGEVILRKPTFDEKYELLEKYGGGLLGKSDDEIDNLEGVRFARGLVKESEQFYEKVDLQSKASGEKYTSFEDMSYEDECHLVMIDIAKTLIMPQEADPEKKSKSQPKSELTLKG